MFAIETGELIEGKLPNSKRKLVEAWMEIHKEDLKADWQLAIQGQKPFPIDPLR